MGWLVRPWLKCFKSKWFFYVSSSFFGMGTKSRGFCVSLICWFGDKNSRQKTWEVLMIFPFQWIGVDSASPSKILLCKKNLCSKNKLCSCFFPIRSSGNFSKRNDFNGHQSQLHWICTGTLYRIPCPFLIQNVHPDSWKKKSNPHSPNPFAKHLKVWLSMMEQIHAI